jgi:hypothetical protein
MILLLLIIYVPIHMIRSTIDRNDHETHVPWISSNRSRRNDVELKGR